MSNHKQTGGTLGKGYYITLILCAAAIGLAGFLYYRNANSPVLSENGENLSALSQKQEDLAVLATQGGENAPSSESPTEATKKGLLKTAAPVSGETVVSYAMDCLSYNQTTRDWRIHNGIDIAAEAGTPVLAAADGQVYTIYEDDAMGTTVVIRHEDGYTTQYSSLGTDLSVSIGDTVTLGQTIGCVGETALLETAIGPHVHFCVTYLDEPMDPAEFLALA